MKLELNDKEVLYLWMLVHGFYKEPSALSGYMNNFDTPDGDDCEWELKEFLMWQLREKLEAELKAIKERVP